MVLPPLHYLQILHRPTQARVRPQDSHDRRSSVGRMAECEGWSRLAAHVV